MLKTVRMLLLGVFAAGFAFAQFDAASVIGSVRDAKGGAVAGVKVALRNLSTGLSLTSESAVDGVYQFVNVPIGRYEVQADHAGFRPVKTAPFELTVNARQRVDFQLEIQSVETTVQVSGEVALIEADSSDHGQVVSARQAMELPLNGRAYSELVYLSAGATPSPSAGSREGSFNANGLRSTFNNFMLDGLDNNYYGTSNQGFSNQVVQLTPDAVAEFKVTTNNMSAEYGRSGGATVNAVARSGSNELHGSAWEFFRNTSLNSVGFFKPLGGRKPQLNRNQFGFTLGGPVVKNRTFFFLNYEGFRQTGSSVEFATLPDAQQRAGVLQVPVVNPLKGSVYMGVVPQSDIIPFAKQVLALLPANTNSFASNNFQTLKNTQDFRDKGDVKIDHMFTSSLRGFFRYSQSRANLFDPGTIPGTAGGDGSGFTQIPVLQAAGGATWNVSHHSILEARFGYSRSLAGKQPALTGGPSMKELFGITGLPEDKRYTGGITYQGFIGGFTSLGRQWTNPQYQHPSVWNPKVNYTRIWNRHTIKTGFEFQAVNVEQMDIHPVYGIDVYAGLMTARASATSYLPTFRPEQTAIYSYADFLLGLRAQILQASPTIANIRERMWFGYVQDDIRVSEKLTLNLGLRYEYATPIYERDNRLSNFDPTGNKIVTASGGSIAGRALVDPDRNNFAPRLGVAYSLMPKTVVRGGYGLSYIHWNRVGSTYLTLNAPFAIIAQRLTIPGTANYRNTQDGYPAGLIDPQKFNPLEATIQYMPKESPSGRVQSWFVSLQTEPMHGLLFDIAYVGNSASNLVVSNDINQARPNAVGQALGVQARRPNQSFASIIGTMPWGYSNYNGLQVKVEKRAAAGLYLLNSFTWSKAIDLASQSLDGGGGACSPVCGNDVPSVQDINNLKADRGLSAYDRPFVNSTSLVWDIPVGKGRRYMSSLGRAADAALGGWQFTAINQMRSGPTLTLVYDPDSSQEVSPLITINGRNMYRPNITGDPVLPSDQRSADRYFDRAKVSVPTASAPFGNAGRNISRGFAFAQLDLGLHKTFRLTERFRLQFRAESFNALNRTNFREPNTDVSSTGFGQVRNTFDPRQFQFALKMQF